MSQTTEEKSAPVNDQVIVRAAIHPGIGVARVGNAESEFYIGPEVTAPQNKPSDFYRTSQGMLKRQAARFRIYGYNAAGEVVSELTNANADIHWTAQVANTKANWFHFITAMDIPETKDLVVTRRNPEISSTKRDELVIAPNAISISGTSVSGSEYQFNTGSFKGENVYLGELQTDEEGHLLFLGGHGVSQSPSGKPPVNEDPDSFNNAPDWFDDISDGPVNAKVNINGADIPVEGSWVISAPPNYAPDTVSWRTMHDLMTDLYVSNGWLPVPEVTSFAKDVLPQLQRLSNLQWVNKGFATLFGAGGQMNFEDSTFVAKLATAPKKPAGSSAQVIDPYRELRNIILNSFRPHDPDNNEPRLWPWLYGDNFDGDLFSESLNTMLALPSLQQLHLQRWAKGEFINDWYASYEEPNSFTDIPLAEQPDMLDKAAMHYCLADAFHPGCELTWLMRHPTLYSAPFRIRQSSVPETDYQWGSSLSQKSVLAIDGPLHAQVAGGLTRWMGLPWQGDTAYCRAGYDLDFDMFQPAFWPARVPNTILSEENYKIVMDKSLPREERIAAFNQRLSWNRFIDRSSEESANGIPSTAEVMKRMVADFAKQGIITPRKGVEDDVDFPAVIYVESNGYSEEAAENMLKVAAQVMLKASSSEASTSRNEQIRISGWASEEQLLDAIRLRQRKRKPTA